MCHYVPLPLRIYFVVPVCFEMLLFGHSMLFLLSLQISLQLLVQCVRDSLFFLVVGNPLMGCLLCLPLFLLLLLLLLGEDSFLLCVDDPLLFVLISEDAFGHHLLLILGMM